MKRFAAPVAFLLALTVAVLLVRSALHQGGNHAVPVTTTTRTTGDYPRVHRKRHRHRPGIRVYTVRSGDTLGSIAQKAGTTVAQLERLNPGVNPTALQVGQKIRVK